MPNIAAAFKSEIARVSRKEIKTQTEAITKANRSHRSDISALRARVQDLERTVARLARSSGRPAAATKAPDEQSSVRFSAKGLASHRKRLGLSAEELARLLGVSGNTVYNWESGTVRPRASVLGAIAEIRALGKREVQKRLEQASVSA